MRSLFRACCLFFGILTFQQQSLPQISVTLALDKSFYCARDTVRFTLTATNASDTAVTLNFPTGQHFDFEIQGYPRWSQGRTFIQIPTSITIPPFDSLVWREAYGFDFWYTDGMPRKVEGWIGNSMKDPLYGLDSAIYNPPPLQGEVTVNMARDTFYQFEPVVANVSFTNHGICDLWLPANDCGPFDFSIDGSMWWSHEIACLPWYTVIPKESTTVRPLSYEAPVTVGTHRAVSLVGSARGANLVIDSDTTSFEVIPHPATLSVTTDKEAYDYGEEIVVTLRFRNPTVAPLNFPFPFNTQQRFDYCIDSAWCWSDDTTFSRWGLSTLSVPPHADTTWHDTIRSPVPDGRRVLSAWIGTKNGEVFHAGDTTEFTVLPPPLKASMRVPKSRFETGEPIPIVFQYENNTDTVHLLSFPTNCHFAYAVGNSPLITEHEECGSDGVVVRLNPGGWARWETMYTEYLQPGKYVIAGWIGGPDSADGYGVNRLTIEVVRGDVVQVTRTMTEGWTLFSLPLEPVSGGMAAERLNGVSRAFAYGEEYVQTDTLRFGTGYWMRFSGGQVSFVGRRAVADTIDVREGWNLIGTLSQVIPLENVSTIPEDNLRSDFFGFTERDGYKPATQLLSGRGYWIRALGPGKIILKK